MDGGVREAEEVEMPQSQKQALLQAAAGLAALAPVYWFQR